MDGEDAAGARTGDAAGKLARDPSEPGKFALQHGNLAARCGSFGGCFLLNGRVISVTIDDDPVRRALSGIISLQVEGGGALWYQNVYLKKLESSVK